MQISSAPPTSDAKQQVSAADLKKQLLRWAQKATDELVWCCVRIHMHMCMCILPGLMINVRTFEKTDEKCISI